MYHAVAVTHEGVKDLDGAKVASKVNRAKEHIDSLRRLVDDFRASGP